MVDELNRHITKNNRHPTSRGCKTRKLEPAQSKLAKLMKALFERIFEEKDGKGKTPLFVGPEGGGGGHSLIATKVCAATTGMVLAPFWSENGYTLCPFWSRIGYGFRGNYGVYERIYRFNYK